MEISDSIKARILMKDSALQVHLVQKTGLWKLPEHFPNQGPPASGRRLAPSEERGVGHSSADQATAGYSDRGASRGRECVM